MKRFYLFGGGSIDPEFVREWISKHEDSEISDYFLAADRGIAAVKELDIRPDVILGDFDSADASDLEEYRKRKDICFEEFPARKDFTDMELAVDKALKMGAEEIILFGATGTRFDHVLGNLYALEIPLKKGIRAGIVDAHNVIELLARGEYTVQKCAQFGKYVSFLPYTDIVKGITLKGFSYPLFKKDMKKGSTLGISNEIKDETATVEFEEGILIYIQSRD